MSKPTVHYTPGSLFFLTVGASCYLDPVDHPNHVEGQHVTNTKTVRTSTVVAYDESTGRVETRNTIYVPLEAAHA